MTLYYLGVVSFYVTEIISLLSSPHDREFRKMMCHHFVTITAAVITWIINLTTPFVLIVTVFDIVDILLPLCKLTGYAKFHKTSDFISIIFAIVWIFTRNFYFWYWCFCLIVYFVLINGINLITTITFFIVFTVAFLNLKWTYYVMKMVECRIYQKKIAHDVRSSDCERE